MEAGLDETIAHPCLVVEANLTAFYEVEGRN